MTIAATGKDADDAATLDDFNITPLEEAAEMVWKALDSTPDEPESFVRMILKVCDRADARHAKDALFRLMEAAYNQSIVHSHDFDKYLDALRAGREPLEEARQEWRRRNQSPEDLPEGVAALSSQKEPPTDNRVEVLGRILSLENNDPRIAEIERILSARVSAEE